MRKQLLYIFALSLGLSINPLTTIVRAEEPETTPTPATTIQTGWVTTEDGHKQWLDETGALVIGWHSIEDFVYHFDNNGYMDTGKHFIINKYYLFRENGVLCSTPGLATYQGNTYWVLEDGSLKISDWGTFSGRTYYFDEEAEKVSGKQNISGVNYYFNENEEKDLFKNGLIQAQNGEWYYAEPSGVLVTSTHKTIGGKTYYFNANSVLENATVQAEVGKTGWQSINDKWYFFNEHGDMETGWISYNGRKYYMKPSGEMATGWVFTDGKYQYLDIFGIQQFGWQLINGKWYYFHENGNMNIGWLSYGGRKYYCKPSGEMAIGWVYTNGHYQYFDALGIQQFGWQNIYGNWYYLDQYGDMQVGWLEYAGKTYYLNASGAMVTGLQWINNKYEYFDQFGALSNESQYKLLNVSNYNQYAEGYPDGCEGISLFQALQYKGYLGGMSLHNFMYTIPTSTNPFYGYAASGGYAAIFPTPLANWGKGYSGGMTFDISGSSFDSLLEEVRNGNPVVAYVTSYYTTPTWRNYPFGPNLYNNHAVTLDGYDRINNLVHISDPISGAKWMDMFTVASVYDARKYAVVVR